jgi:hypothetical protein
MNDPRRRIRAIAVSVAVVSAVTVAVVALSAVRAERPESAATASPVAAATPTATVPPSATPTAGSSPSSAAATDRYGYVSTTSAALGSVFNGDQPIVVRRERDASMVFELTGVLPAVSTDGKRLAYWRTTPNAGATELRVLDVADPRSDRIVLTLDAQTLGGTAVWSNDGLGLLIWTFSRERSVSPGPESCPLRSDLVMLDLGTVPATTRSAGSGGCTLVPVAWDRPGRIAAAVVTGSGGYATEWMTWNGNAASPFASAKVPSDPSSFPSTLLLAFSVQASSDAKLVMGLESSDNVLRVWPILDITKADEVRHPSRISSAIWRPGTGATSAYEVIWGVGPKLDLFRYQTDSTGTLYTGTSDVGPVAMRPDGSGVMLMDAGHLIVVDITTRQTTAVSAVSGLMQILPRAVFLR